MILIDKVSLCGIFTFYLFYVLIHIIYIPKYKNGGRQQRRVYDFFFVYFYYYRINSCELLVRERVYNGRVQVHVGCK